MKVRTLDSVIERRKEKVIFAEKFGKHLRKVRQTKGISQENLSIEAGYYRTYINKIELGRYSPSLHTIWRIANTLKMSLSEFLRDF